MDKILQQITNLGNLHWSWEKAKKAFRPEYIWIDELEVARFESNLNYELLSIKKDIERGSYKMSPIMPVVFPKSPDNNGPRARQMFYISVRDQVAWLAVTNTIGPLLDYKMPFWSYGNRLYIPAFYEKNKITQKKELKFGWYRHTSRHIYRKWRQCWPIYRKHIAITTRIMAKWKNFKKDENTFKEDDLEFEKDREIFDNNKKLPKFIKVKYLNQEYWTRRLSGEIYWAGIDLEKFYPNTSTEIILDNFRKYIPREKKSEELFCLLSRLLKFEVNTSEWNGQDLGEIDLNRDKKHFEGIPTGLLVAGFLANVALLEVDRKVKLELGKKRNIAHFRFVDDHVILSDNFEDLINWLKWYSKTLNIHNPGSKINIKKFEPQFLSKYLKYSSENELTEDETSDIKEEAKKTTKLDPDFPTPLMTQTLAKVSQIMQTEFDLLESKEEDQLIADIEHLLVTDFPDHEWRRDTRISWAATMISHLVPRKRFDISDILENEKRILELKEEIKKFSEFKKVKKDNNKERIVTNHERIKEAKIKISSLEDRIKEIERKQNKEEKRLKKHAMKLLLKAIRENHDKRKLWRRSIEFCRRTGNEGLQKILDLLDWLEQKKLASRLSLDYLYSLIVSVLSVESIYAYRTIENNNEAFKNKERATIFLKNVLGIKFLKTIFQKGEIYCSFYSQKSLHLFRFVLGCIGFTLKNKQDKSGNIREVLRIYLKIESYKFGIIDWEKEPEQFFKNHEYSIDIWVWWILNKMTDKLSSIPHPI